VAICRLNDASRVGGSLTIPTSVDVFEAQRVGKLDEPKACVMNYIELELGLL
jgi:hypothetical protein